MPLSPDYLQYKNNTKNLKMEAVNEGSERGGGERGGGGRWRHDDIPKEKIIGILEAEKAKILEQESNNYLNRELGLSSIKNGDSVTTTTHNSRRGKSVGNVDNEYSVSNKVAFWIFLTWIFLRGDSATVDGGGASSAAKMFRIVAYYHG